MLFVCFSLINDFSQLFLHQIIFLEYNCSQEFQPLFQKFEYKKNCFLFSMTLKMNQVDMENKKNEMLL